MAAIITEKFRIHNARQFKEDFADATSSTYLFIGRPYVILFLDETGLQEPHTKSMHMITVHQTFHQLQVLTTYTTLLSTLCPQHTMFTSVSELEETVHMLDNLLLLNQQEQQLHQSQLLMVTFGNTCTLYLPQKQLNS